MPEKLGPYRIERLLGRGGMGAVYAAVHQETGQTAAVKVLSAAIADHPRFRARFMAEVETLQKLKHANIVGLFGWGEEDGLLFYAMELVKGRSLQDEMQAGRLFTWQVVARYAIDVCAALKHAHDSGVIHRDLKPANLLLTSGDSIKLTDFGIAKLFGSSNITAEGSVIGTADYMAPEQAEGKPISNRTDLYSLGAVMFTLLARRTPFARASLPQVIHGVRFDEAPLVRTFAPNVPAEFETIIEQLLRKDPKDRVPTALVLSNRLKAMLHALGNAKDAGGSSAEPLINGDSPTTINEPSQEHDDQLTSIRGDSKSRKSRDDPNTPAAEVTVATGSPAAADATSHDVQTLHAGSHFTANREFSSESVAAEIPATFNTETWKTIGGLTLLVTILAIAIATLVYQQTPDAMYSRIQAAAAEQRTADVKDIIDDFLEKFPSDPRHAEVQDWRLDVESGWLKSRLILRSVKSGGSELLPFEKLYLDAMAARETDREGAVEQFRSLITDYGSDPKEDVSKYVVAARHQLKRLGFE